jgi:predicted phage terminase large subunit-like protein
MQAILDEEIKRRVTASLYCFVRYFWPVVDPNPFLDNWHIGATCDHLQAVAKGDIKQLLQLYPPRHAKSIIMNVMFPAWVWTWQPSTRILSATASSTNGTRDADKARALIMSDPYQAMFGESVKPSPTNWGKTNYTNTLKGSRVAITTSGGTGKDADLALLDDPQEDAYMFSALYRQRTWDWFTGTFKTRLSSSKAGMVVTMQRLHEDDLIGRILEDEARASEYNILCFPAEYEPSHPIQISSSLGFTDPRKEAGEPLWPERFGHKYLDEQKRDLGSQKAIAQLQQRPAPVDGVLIPKEAIHYTTRTRNEILRDAEAFEMSVDATFKDAANSDFVAILVMARVMGVWYVVDGCNERLSFTKTVDRVSRFMGMYKVTTTYIEDKANGSAIIEVLRQKATGIRAVTPHESKQARASAVVPFLESSDVQFLKDHAFTATIVEQMLSFPFGKHDDMVDALTQFINARVAKKRTILDAF